MYMQKLLSSLLQCVIPNTTKMDIFTTPDDSDQVKEIICRDLE